MTIARDIERRISGLLQGRKPFLKLRFPAIHVKAAKALSLVVSTPLTPSGTWIKIHLKPSADQGKAHSLGLSRKDEKYYIKFLFFIKINHFG